MLHTAEWAQGHMFCPLLIAGGRASQGVYTLDDSKCFGPKCMFWRWNANKELGPTALGYCGAAGTP